MASSSSVARSGGATSGGLFAKNRMELSITLSDVDILLHPQPYDSADEASASFGNNQATKTVIVHAALSIPPTIDPPDRIASMQVELRSDEVVGFSDGVFEKNKPHQLTLNVESARDMTLSRGNVYQWDIPMPISHRTAPYERGVYGRLFHKVIVTIQWPGIAGWWKGGGRLLQAEQPVFIAAASRDASVLSYARMLNGHARDLGPVLFHIRTRHLSVGGYIRLAFSLPRAPKGIRINALHATMIQETTLHSRQQPAQVERCSPERIGFWKQSGEELDTVLKRTSSTTNAEFEEIEGEWIVRLPHDSQMRPTSLQGSESAIRHEHYLEMKVAFYKESQLLAYTTRWPISLPACGMLWRSVKLPQYSESDPSPVPEWSRDAWEPEKFANIHVSQTCCACGQSTEKLLGWEREGDIEQNSVTSDDLHDAIRFAALTIDAGHRRPSSRSRSRSRNVNSSTATSRSVSRRPSLDDVLQTEGEILEEDDEADDGQGSDFAFDDDDAEAQAVELERIRQRQMKEAQLYNRNV